LRRPPQSTQLAREWLATISPSFANVLVARSRELVGTQRVQLVGNLVKVAH
jgi:hypothetical protein